MESNFKKFMFIIIGVNLLVGLVLIASEVSGTKKLESLIKDKSELLTDTVKSNSNNLSESLTKINDSSDSIKETVDEVKENYLTKSAFDKKTNSLLDAFNEKFNSLQNGVNNNQAKLEELAKKLGDELGTKNTELKNSLATVVDKVNSNESDLSDINEMVSNNDRLIQEIFNLNKLEKVRGHISDASDLVSLLLIQAANESYGVIGTATELKTGLTNIKTNILFELSKVKFNEKNPLANTTLEELADEVDTWINLIPGDGVTLTEDYRSVFNECKTISTDIKTALTNLIVA